MREECEVAGLAQHFVIMSLVLDNILSIWKIKKIVLKITLMPIKDHV